MLLRDNLMGQSYDAIVLREPTEGKYGSEIRRLAKLGTMSPETEAELFILDRREDVALNIRPALDRGRVVIMDRYYLSNVAYQAARGIDREELIKRNEAFAPKPDLVFIFDLPVEEGLSRARNRGGPVELHFENVAYLRGVRGEFRKFAGDPGVVYVDAMMPAPLVEGMLLQAALIRLMAAGVANAMGSREPTEER